MFKSSRIVLYKNCLKSLHSIRKQDHSKFDLKTRFYCKSTTTCFIAGNKPKKIEQDADKFKLYTLLNLRRNATLKDIKQSYYELAKVFHPDACGSSQEAYIKFQQINEAYEVLSDVKKRFNYDKFGIVSSSHLVQIQDSRVQQQPAFKISPTSKLRQLCNIVYKGPDKIMQTLFPASLNRTADFIDCGKNIFHLNIGF